MVLVLVPSIFNYYNNYICQQFQFQFQLLAVKITHMPHAHARRNTKGHTNTREHVGWWRVPHARLTVAARTTTEI